MLVVRMTTAVLCTLCTLQATTSFGIVPQKLSSSSLTFSSPTHLFNAAASSSEFEDGSSNSDSEHSDSVNNAHPQQQQLQEDESSPNPQRLSEFADLEPVVMSDMRRQRILLDKENKRQFAEYGNDLWNLRSTMDILSQKLIENLSTPESSPKTEKFIRRELRRAESRDPELMYQLQLQAMEEASREGRMEDAEQHSELARAARSCLPQFNLEGLWVGKYGTHGYEMINVTYVGDTLIASKVTGDKNVPMGEITFQANLSPQPDTLRQVGGESDKSSGGAGALEENAKRNLDPIKLSDAAAKKWGTKQLPRYSGLGQVAEEGHKNRQWMDGQLIVIGQEYFSFAWVPIEHQIFFGRPSPELAIKMLKDKSTIVQDTPSFLFGGEKSWGDSPPTVDDDVHVLKDYAHYLLQTTRDVIDDEYNGNDHAGCIYHDDDMEECAFQ